MVRNTAHLVGVRRVVHHVGGRVALSFHAHRGGTAAVQVQGILRIEVLHKELRHFRGGHAPAHAGATPVDDHEQEMIELIPGDDGAGMGIRTLVDIRIFRVGELLGIAGAESLPRGS